MTSQDVSFDEFATAAATGAKAMFGVMSPDGLPVHPYQQTVLCEDDQRVKILLCAKGHNVLCYVFYDPDDYKKNTFYIGLATDSGTSVYRVLESDVSKSIKIASNQIAAFLLGESLQRQVELVASIAH